MKNKNLSYDEWAHRFGKLSLTVGMLATVLFPALLILVFHVPVDWSFVLAGAGNILLLMIPVSLSEFLSIAPMIGTSAMYIMVLAYRSGWLKENRVDLLISKGVGTSVWPGRLFCFPQIHYMEVSY